MNFTLECTRQDDGRWLAEVPQLHGAAAYGGSEAGARAKAQAVALRILAEQLEVGGCAPFEIAMAIIPVRNADDPDPTPSPPADQAAYDAWLVAKVKEARDDDSPTMSTEEVMRYVTSDADPESPAPTDRAAYDAWLAAEVQEALDDESPSIPHEEAMRMVRAALAAK